jgi:hypothetical protein
LLLRVDIPKASEIKTSEKKQAREATAYLLPDKIWFPGMRLCVQTFDERVLRVHMLGPIGKAVLAVEERDVSEHGAGVMLQQRRPERIPALVNRAAWHKYARIAAAILAFTLPLRLYEI